MIDCPLCHHEKLLGEEGTIEMNKPYTRKKYIVCSDCFDKIQKKIDVMEAKKPDEKEIYSAWCVSIMAEIERIAKEKYPDVKYWVDTGSRWNVCMAMLDQFRKDIKGASRWTKVE